jgi:E3 ubiquitin-protein ligase SHPRH
MGRKGGIDKFKNDPDIECFLLDAKANSSGLNLVNATHVFLCEPLINTALELQAIARVHRIGQYRPTTIWMYLVDGTVEKSIYEISVSRRISHMGDRPAGVSGCSADTLERNIDAANSLEMEQTPLAKLLAKGDGEMVQNEDLWSCLFHHPRKGQMRESGGTS